jgi:hypothetical protein
VHEKKFVLQSGAICILTIAVTFPYVFLEYDVNKNDQITDKGLKLRYKS